MRRDKEGFVGRMGKLNILVGNRLMLLGIGNFMFDSSVT